MYEVIYVIDLGFPILSTENPLAMMGWSPSDGAPLFIFIRILSINISLFKFKYLEGRTLLRKGEYGMGLIKYTIIFPF